MTGQGNGHVKEKSDRMFQLCKIILTKLVNFISQNIEKAIKATITLD